jgi:hypothetical protein
MTTQNNSPFNTLESLMAAWKANCESCSTLWQGPAAYWQTVASIMNLRAQCTQKLLETGAQGITAALSSPSPAQAVGQIAQSYATVFTLLTDLNLNTHQQRLALWRQLQLLATRAAPASSWQAYPQASEAFTPKATDGTQTSASVVPQPATQPKPSSKGYTYTAAPKGWFVAGAKSQKEQATQPMQAATPTLVKTETQAVQPDAPQGAAAATAGTPPLFTIVSRTGDASVVRSGAAIGAISAARRSVIARRSQRKMRAR